MTIIPYQSTSYLQPGKTCLYEDEVEGKPADESNAAIPLTVITPSKNRISVSHDALFKLNSLYKTKIVDFLLQNGKAARCNIQQQNKIQLPIHQSNKKGWKQILVHNEALVLYGQARRELERNGNKKTINELFIKAMKLFNESRRMGPAKKDIFAENLFCCGFVYYHFKYYLNAVIHMELAEQLCPERNAFKETKEHVLSLIYNMSAKNSLEWIDRALAIENINLFSKVDLMFCKVEALNLLAETGAAVETAKNLLDILNKEHPLYKRLEYKIANPQNPMF